MKVSVKSQAGFSLVELMVVVAIIGILAAIAIPNFQRFTAKSKQAEITSNLAVLYSAEKAFWAEWSTYDTTFQYIGYAPTGYMRYGHGFATAFSAPPGNFTAPGGAAGAANFNTNAPYCSAGTAPAAPNNCSIITVPVASAGPQAGTTATSTTMLAGGQAYIGAAGIQDAWTMDQNKTLTNTVNGLP